MKILVTGVTGYIGGSVAKRLVSLGHEVIGVSRSPAAEKTAKELGITVLGIDLNSVAPIEKLLRSVDAVVNCADSDNAHFIATALKTMKGTHKRFLHTSGSSIIGDKAEGEFSQIIHHEENVFPLLEKNARVAIDRAVIDSARDGIHSIVICPTMIYGEGRGPKKHSIQIPMLTDYARKTGGAKHIGAGENVWSNVHIDDLVELYVLALEKAPAGAFFFAENGEASLKNISRAINQSLAIAQTPQSITIDTAILAWGADAAQFAFGSNSRVTSAKARQGLGWAPKHDSLIEETGKGPRTDS